MNSLESTLTLGLIKEEAGERTFRDGEDAYYGGMVQALTERDGVYRAEVLGANLCKVELAYDTDNDELEYDCSCPLGGDGEFCKHLVAAALTVVDRCEDPSLVEDAAPDLDVDEIRRCLKKRKKAELIELVVDQLDRNENLRHRLSLEVAIVGRNADEEALREAIEQVAFVEDVIKSDQVPAYIDKVDHVLDVIESLIDQGDGERVMKLTVFAVGVLEDALDSMDDHYDQAAALLRRVADIHYRACVAVHPDPKRLAEDLLELELNSERELFNKAFDKYGDLLGGEGKNAYRKIVERRWRSAPSFAPGEVNPERYGLQGKLTRIMETLARDVDQLIKIKSKDLSTPYDFLEIAKLYRDDDQPEKAREWAERGLDEFPDSTAVCLPEFLADEYQRRGEIDLAMKRAWKMFESAPNFESYKTLKGFAERNRRWAEFQRRAIEFLRSHIQKVRNETGPMDLGPMADFSRLVEIFLWEGDAEAAWKEANVGGCSEDLWLRLAKLRQESFPEDAAEIYQRRARGILARDDAPLYDEAIDLLTTTKTLLVRVGKVKEFSDFLADLLTSNYRRRDFISLLKTANI